MDKISPFEHFVLAAIADREQDGLILREQVQVAFVAHRDPTGVGIFTKFSFPETPRKLLMGSTMRQGDPHLWLAHPLVPAGVGVILWLTDGLIDTLECYTYDGDWPSDDSLFTVSEA